MGTWFPLERSTVGRCAPMRTNMATAITDFSALGVFHVMRYINVRYLLTYLLTY